MPDISITWDDIDKWQNTQEQVYEILEKHTKRRQYPETKSLPPIIFGINECPQDGISELEALDGVKVRKVEDY